MTSISNSPTRPDPLSPELYIDLVRRALAEDIGAGDVTTHATVPARARARASLVARQACVVAGLEVARETFRQVDAAVRFEQQCADGDRVESGAVLARLEGPARGVLTAERTALNFLQHLSGIATHARAFVDAAGGRLTVLDTRKTLPTFRALAKYAVRCGGGTNHRTGLFDAVLIKDNHIRVAGGIAKAVRLARQGAPGLPVEVEAQNLDEVGEATEAKVDAIMLDNMSDDDVRAAVRRIAGRARIEISGGMTLARVAALADCGADCVSVGQITHSPPAIDISLDVEVDPAG